MSAYNTSDYYKHNIPAGKKFHVIDDGSWNGAAPVTLLVQPGAGQCYFIKNMVLRVNNAFAMSAGDSIVITVDAYDDSTFEQHTISNVTPLIKLIRLGDPDSYLDKTIAGVQYHVVKIPCEPPLYLRSSTTTAESISFVYNDVAGGITAGDVKIDVNGWEMLETDSGL
jgi:hypothetical protein